MIVFEKGVLKRTIKLLLACAFLVNSVVLPTSGANKSKIDDVAAKINALPAAYSGIPLLNGTVEDVSYKYNALPIKHDHSVSFEGKNPVKVTAEKPFVSGDASTYCYFGKYYTQPQDLSELTNVELLLWFYEPDPRAKLTGVRVILETSDKDYLYSSISSDYWNKQSGPCRIRINLSDFEKKGGPTLQAITAVKIRIYGEKGVQESVGLFSVSYNARSTPKVVLTFDDGWQDNIDYAFPILEWRKIKATVYACSDFAKGTDPNYMRSSSLIKLYKAGWDVGNHTNKHLNYQVRITDLKIMVDGYKSCMDYLKNLGFGRSYQFVCYPDGHFDDKLIAELKKIGVISGRTTRIGLNTMPPVDIYKMRQVTVGPKTTFGVDNTTNDIKAVIDKAIASGQTLMIMMHRIVPDKQMVTPEDVTNGYKTSVTMLKTIADYLIKTGVKTATMSEWYKDLDKIDYLGLEDAATVEAARAAYEALSTDEQALVPNLKKLKDAEAKIKQLKSTVKST